MIVLSGALYSLKWYSMLTVKATDQNERFGWSNAFCLCSAVPSVERSDQPSEPHLIPGSCIIDISEKWKLVMFAEEIRLRFRRMILDGYLYCKTAFLLERLTGASGSIVWLTKHLGVKLLRQEDGNAHVRFSSSLWHMTSLHFFICYVGVCWLTCFRRSNLFASCTPLDERNVPGSNLCSGDFPA